MKIKAIAIALLIILLSSFSYVLREYVKQRNEIVRLNENIGNLGVENSTLRFTSKELSEYMENLNTAHKSEIDSITKLLKVKPKQIISYETITNTIVDTVEVEASVDKIAKPNDSTYRYKVTKGCFDISGSIITKDPNTKLFVDSLVGSNTIYIVKHYKKSFWDVIFFRKGNEVVSMTSDCGDNISSKIVVE